MRNLQVEALEPRQMLNGTGFSPPSPALYSFPAGAPSARVFERAPLVDYCRGCAGPSGRGMPGDTVPGIDPPRDAFFEALSGRNLPAPAPHGPAPGSDLETRSDSRVPGTLGIGVAPPAAGFETAVVSESPRVAPGVAVSAPGPADGGRGVPAASLVAALGGPAQPSIVQSTPSPGIVVGTPGSRTDLRAPATRVPVREVPEASGAGGAAVPLAAGQEAEQYEEGSLPPSPHVSGVLSALPPFGLSALELGMQQFLERLGRLGPSIDGHPDGAGLSLWIAAAAAAAAACEIARRQVKGQESGGRGQGSAIWRPDPGPLTPDP
jgi:hypothetical protein